MQLKYWSCVALVGFIFLAQGVIADSTTATASQVNQCLVAATKAKAGGIGEIDIDNEDGRKVCKVKIYTQNQKFKVKVDLSNYRVVKVEEDD